MFFLFDVKGKVFKQVIVPPLSLLAGGSPSALANVCKEATYLQVCIFSNDGAKTLETQDYFITISRVIVNFFFPTKMSHAC